MSTRQYFPFLVQTASPKTFRGIVRLYGYSPDDGAPIQIAGFNSEAYAVEFACKHATVAPDLNTVVYVVHRDELQNPLRFYQHGKALLDVEEVLS